VSAEATPRCRPVTVEPPARRGAGAGSSGHTETAERHAGDDDVGGLDATALEDHRLDAVGAAECGHAGAEAELDAVVGVELTEHGADLVTEHALQRDGGGIDEHDLGAHLAR